MEQCVFCKPCTLTSLTHHQGWGQQWKGPGANSQLPSWPQTHRRGTNPKHHPLGPRGFPSCRKENVGPPEKKIKQLEMPPPVGTPRSSIHAKSALNRILGRKTPRTGAIYTILPFSFFILFLKRIWAAPLCLCYIMTPLQPPRSATLVLQAGFKQSRIKHMQERDKANKFVPQ